MKNKLPPPPKSKKKIEAVIVGHKVGRLSSFKSNLEQTGTNDDLIPAALVRKIRQLSETKMFDLIYGTSMEEEATLP